MSATNSIAQQAEQISAGVLRFARFGYISRGLVYLIVGGMALQIAFGEGGSAPDKKDALVEIATQPYGMVLLALVAFGLFSYSAWRLMAAIRDLEDDGSDAKGLILRASYLVSFVVYGALGIVAVQIIINSAASADGDSSQDWTAKLLAQPWGVWLVGTIGAIIILTGCFQFYIAYKAKFMEKMKTHEMSAAEKTWTERSGRIGYAARGGVYLLIGSFLIQAALQRDPSEAGGLAKALSTLAQQPYGPWLLGIVAIGLMGFGVYSIVQALYRRIGHT